MTETEAIAILAATPFICKAKISQLIASFGTAVAAMNMTGEEIASIKGFSRCAANWGWWNKNDGWARHWQRIENGDFTLHAIDDPHYPRLLKECSDAPVVLYMKGFLGSDAVSVVGSRNADGDAIAAASQVAEALAEEGISVVSGLARGVDSAAHRAALAAKGHTTAVLGSGLERIYPKENIQLASEIAKEGALISEYPSEQGPEKHHFLARNRIIAGIGSAMVLIEADINGGSMQAARKAKKIGRPLFAFGRSAGGRKLIEDGDAEEISGAAALIDLLRRREKRSYPEIAASVNHFEVYKGRAPATGQHNRSAYLSRS